MALSYLALGSAAEWQQLEDTLKLDQSVPAIATNLVKRLRELGAKSVVTEESYLDRDFSEAYAAYYSTTFRRHTKLCTRLLFFSDDVSFIPSTTNVADLVQTLEAASFLGQIVLRPVSQAPVNQALLAAPPSPAGHEGHLLVRSEYSAHILGAELRVEAVPMTQQDSRIGACAQAAIWVTARHFHQRHRGPWLSTVSITRNAIANSEAQNNLMLPAGSEALSANNMVAALRAAGREPLIFAAHGNPPNWGNTRPADIINRYVDSGIPVILGLSLPGQSVGHAVVVTGQVFRLTPPTVLPANPTRAEYVEAFYANDDQIGPNVRVGVKATSALGETPYSIENVSYLIIPLPGKVYLPAEKAESIAWSVMQSYGTDWNGLKAQNTAKIGTSIQAGDALTADLVNNQVVARTYLTYGWKYKKRAIQNRLPNSVKQAIRDLELPRFVYVTEFARTVDVNGRSQFDRRISAHCVVDATAKNQGVDTVLFMHAPGYCAFFSHDSASKMVRSMAVVSEAGTYYPKARGDITFAEYKKSQY